MRYCWLLLSGCLSSQLTFASGVDCNTLAEWSSAIGSSKFEVNQHHVFCGEPGKKGAAKGFHASVDGVFPSSYVSSTGAEPANSAGVYTLRKIKLDFHGKEYTKSFSSMFPKNCSLAQINQSIVYSRLNSTGTCAETSWAQCGPNAPENDTS